MNISEILTSKKELFTAVHKRSHTLNVSLKQAYYGVLSEVQKEFPKYQPYANFESFKIMYYRKSR